MRTLLLVALMALTGCQCGPGGSGDQDGGTCAQGQLFEQCHPWTRDVSDLAPHPESNAIIGALAAAGGWGSGNFRTERSIVILDAPPGTPYRAFTPTANFYSPDCDDVPFPVPPGGALEGESGYACTTGGDCHLIVIDRPAKRLYEMWTADITGPSPAEFQGGCAVVWDLARQYDGTLRGKGCTSADGAGFPIAAMLATADEVYAGEVKHALRFILPNSRIRDGIYVPPGTHSTGPTSGGPNMPPYGVRFRLKRSFNVNSLSSVRARVIATALQRYGMFLADGGNIPLTIANDRFTTHQWSEVGITNDLALASLTVNDFEVVDMGTPVNWNADTDCYRNP